MLRRRMPTSFAVNHSATAVLTPADLARAFTGQVERPGVRPLYLLGLALVAAAMICLPIIYLGLVAGAAYGVYAYAVFLWNNVLDGSARTTGGLWGTVLYLAPLFAGVVLVLFLIKPIFAPRRRRPETFTLGRDSDPLLHGYVEHLCTLMRAPVPKRIDVDELPNASASFRSPRRGGVFGTIAAWIWMIKGDVVLTIGLPFAAGMTTQQLTGVLAHEFGHFTQRIAMRLGWIIGTINAWLARTAFERDAWDDYFERLRAKSDNTFGMPLVLAVQLIIWLTRLLLKGLVIVAHALSCFMSRQMEYDADAWQCRVTGSKEFSPLFDQVELLGAGAEAVFASMNDRWRERRLPDDLPMLIAQTARGFPAVLRKRILSGLGPDGQPPRRSLFATHPTRAERQAAAEALDCPGVFRLDAPATHLFADFSSLCKQATYNHCKLVLGNEISTVTFTPTRELVAQTQAQTQAHGAIEEFFMDDQLAVQLHPRIDPLLPQLGDARATAVALKDARKAMRNHLAQARTQMEADAAAWKTELLAWRAKSALAAGIKATKEEASAGIRTLEQARAVARAAEEAVDLRFGAKDPFRDAASTRIASALALYRHPDVARKIPSAAADLAAAEAMVSACATLANARTPVRMIMRNIACADRLIEFLERHQRHEAGIEKLAAICRDLSAHVNSLSNMLATEPYPFPHAAGNLTMASFIVGAKPPPDYLIDVVNHSRECLDRYWTTRHRALMPLVEMTLRMERALGLATRAAPERAAPASHPA